MPRRYELKRGSEADTELRKAIKAYNERIRYHTRKNPNVIMPPKVKYTDIKKSIYTRKGYNEQLRKLKTFTSESAKPVEILGGKKTVTKYQLDRYSRQLKKWNSIGNEMLKKEDPYKGLMGTVKRGGLSPKKSFLDKNEDYTDAQIMKMFRQMDMLGSADYHAYRAEQYHKNYFKSIVDNMGEEAMDALSWMYLIPKDVLYWNFYEDPNLQIGYTSEPVPVGDRIHYITNTWRDIINRNYSSTTWGKEILNAISD